MTKNEKILKRALMKSIIRDVLKCCKNYKKEKHPGPCIYTPERCTKYLMGHFIRKAKEELK